MHKKRYFLLQKENDSVIIFVEIQKLLKYVDRVLKKCLNFSEI